MDTIYTTAITDVFNQANYADITEELVLFRQSAIALPCSYKATMLISFVKDHMIRSDLVRAYPELVSHITSRQTAVKHLERLFEACRANIAFQKDFEIYIRHQLE
jgi:hypothetical protein